MSYLTLPRLYFSGTFQANPSTLNNIKRNYKPSVYPSIEDLDKAALVWNPMGNGGFDFKDCLVTRVDYADGTSATTSTEDSIIGQPVSAVRHSGFPLPATLVDLDVEQQGVSEVWSLVIQIGEDSMGVRGDFAPAAFNSMWLQAQSPIAPRGSSSSSAVYQSKLRDAVALGDVSTSRFLTELLADSKNALSIQFVVNSHNNSPELFLFNTETLNALAEQGVSASVLEQLEPLQNMGMSLQRNGMLPTLEFVQFALKQQLSTQDYNANIETIVKVTRQQPYEPFTPNDFTFGSVAGVVGTSQADSPNYFVPSRMMNQQEGVSNAWWAPFQVSDDGLQVTVNLGNSLGTTRPGKGFDEHSLGDLWLVSFDSSESDVASATKLTQIDYTDPSFITERAGFVSYTSHVDLSKTPLGILSEKTSDGEVNSIVLLAEDPDGWYLRADQFVFRMNPGVTSTPENATGDTATLNVHALQFGQPAPDGTQIQIADAFSPSEPADALQISPEPTASTVGGIASFTLTATDPGNPREFLNGQLYRKSYSLADNPTRYAPVPGDIFSILVFDQEATDEAVNILAEYGRMYLIMSFLADQQAIEGIDLRNMIKLLLEKPLADAVHMPVTRDLSFADRQKVVSWIDALNNS